MRLSHTGDSELLTPMIAWPADYGESGIMTFMIGQDGVLRQKDLGPQTTAVAPVIDAFDPDSTWEPAISR